MFGGSGRIQPAPPSGGSAPAPSSAADERPIGGGRPSATAAEREDGRGLKLGVIFVGTPAGLLLKQKVAEQLQARNVVDVLMLEVHDLLAIPSAVQDMASHGVQVAIATAVVANDVLGARENAVALGPALMNVELATKVPVVRGLLQVASEREVMAAAGSNPRTWAVTAILRAKGGSQVVAATPLSNLFDNATPPPETSNRDAVTLLNELKQAINVTGPQAGQRVVQARFNRFDTDGSRTIGMEEFKQAAKSLNLPWSTQEIESVYRKFDADNSGSISLDEFMATIRRDVSSLNEKRIAVVNSVFDALDKDHSGAVEAADFMDTFDPSGHPEFRNGSKTKQQVLTDWLMALDSIQRDGRITKAEFQQHWAATGADIRDDEQFEETVRSAWRYVLEPSTRPKRGLRLDL